MLAITDKYLSFLKTEKKLNIVASPIKCEPPKTNILELNSENKNKQEIKFQRKNIKNPTKISIRKKESNNKIGKSYNPNSKRIDEIEIGFDLIKIENNTVVKEIKNNNLIKQLDNKQHEEIEGNKSDNNNDNELNNKESFNAEIKFKEIENEIEINNSKIQLPY